MFDIGTVAKVVFGLLALVIIALVLKKKPKVTQQWPEDHGSDFDAVGRVKTASTEKEQKNERR